MYIHTSNFFITTRGGSLDSRGLWGAWAGCGLCTRLPGAGRDWCASAKRRRHWHGAGPDRFFVHLAMTEVDETGSVTDWFEHVTDEVYAAAPDPIA